MENTFICSICGEVHPIENQSILDGQLLCPDCLEEHTILCQWCRERILCADNAGTDDCPLCQTCYEEYYFTCNQCGSLVPLHSAYYLPGDEDENYPYCSSCHHKLTKGHIRDYYYKPTPVFYGTGPRFMGVELEIDGAGEYGRNAKELLDIANADQELIYCKHDGSLENGFEIVTHPMSLDFHRTQMPWEEICQKSIEMGYTSHKAGTCGLHVHVSRDAFGSTEEEQDACIARVLYFFEKNWEELLKFSRRTKIQLARWAARYGYKDQPKEILDHAKKGGGGGRYSCVNLTNDDTIEFRVFRGTLKYSSLIATLQMVDRICDVAICLTDDQLRDMSWTTFVSGCQAPELVQYLKERRLYLNEPVTAEVEV